jgi:hypothetical protein
MEVISAILVPVINTKASIRLVDTARMTNAVETYLGMSKLDLSKYLTVIAPWTFSPTPTDINATTNENIATKPYAAGSRTRVKTGSNRNGTPATAKLDKV